MEIFPLRDVYLFLSVFIDKSSRPFGLFVKPMRDIRPCSLNDRLGFRKMPVLLDEGAQVVHIAKKGHPDVVGSVVALQLRENVVFSFFVGLRDQLFVIICCTLFTHQ